MRKHAITEGEGRCNAYFASYIHARIRCDSIVVRRWSEDENGGQKRRRKKKQRERKRERKPMRCGNFLLAIGKEGTEEEKKERKRETGTRRLPKIYLVASSFSSATVVVGREERSIGQRYKISRSSWNIPSGKLQIVRGEAATSLARSRQTAGVL